VQQYEGTIEVQSVYGEGTTFTFTLKLGEPTLVEDIVVDINEPTQK